MSKFKKIALGIILLLVLIVLVDYCSYYSQLKKLKESMPTGTTPPVKKERQIVKKENLQYLEGESEPENLGNQEEPIPDGQKDSDGTNLAKFSSHNGAFTLLKGIVLIKNSDERTLTLRIHKDDQIKTKILADAYWIAVIDGEQTKPKDFFAEIHVLDYLTGNCTDESCAALDHITIQRKH